MRLALVSLVVLLLGTGVGSACLPSETCAFPDGLTCTEYGNADEQGEPGHFSGNFTFFFVMLDSRGRDLSPEHLRVNIQGCELRSVEPISGGGGTQQRFLYSCTGNQDYFQYYVHSFSFSSSCPDIAYYEPRVAVSYDGVFLGEGRLKFMAGTVPETHPSVRLRRIQRFAIASLFVLAALGGLVLLARRMWRSFLDDLYPTRKESEEEERERQRETERKP